MAFFLTNCGEEEEAEPNKPPTVSITSPSNNANIQLGESVTITVTANDPDGSVSNVKIYIDNVEEESFNAPPYSLTVSKADAEVGSHTIKAVATDNEGLTAQDQITVTLVQTDPPTVTTADIADITAATATGGGNVTEDGGKLNLSTRSLRIQYRMLILGLRLSGHGCGCCTSYSKLYNIWGFI
jgi:hypothetical protein